MLPTLGGSAQKVISKIDDACVQFVQLRATYNSIDAADTILEAMSINAITPIEEFWSFMEAVRSHLYMIKLLSIVPAVLSGETIGPPVEAAMARFLVLDARYQASCTSIAMR